MTERTRTAARPRLLDLFCGAGGAAVGYHRAGFEVVGVDIKPQPNYPFRFIREDAIALLKDAARGMWSIGHVQAIHASPPCQAWTAYKRTGNVGEYPDLIADVRDLLDETDLPWVIENVEGAPLHEEASLLLCGSMFDETLDIRRHRLFEFSLPFDDPLWPCRHKLQAAKRFPGGRSKEQGGDNRHPARMTVEIGTWDIPLETQQAAMGIDWMTLEELSEAIPPVYTEFVGGELMKWVKRKSVAA